ncbi:MAG TPA: type IV toxin-antitoxin system AbiEi family antitoxin domain-containing protein [Jiangellaceae bacterium]
MRHSRLNALAHDQDGLVTRRQALAAGVSPDAIRHYVRAGGRWQVVVPGIYATFTGPLAEIHRLRATVLHCGNGAVITGMAACRMVGLKYVPGGTAEVDVLVHRRHHPRDIDFIRVHRTVRLPDAVWWMDMASPGAADDIANARPWWHPGNELAPLAQRWVTPMAPIQRSVIDAARIYSWNGIASAMRRRTQNVGTRSMPHWAGPSCRYHPTGCATMLPQSGARWLPRTAKAFCVDRSPPSGPAGPVQGLRSRFRPR